MTNPLILKSLTNGKPAHEERITYRYVSKYLYIKQFIIYLPFMSIIILRSWTNCKFKTEHKIPLTYQIVQIKFQQTAKSEKFVFWTS